MQSWNQILLRRVCPLLCSLLICAALWAEVAQAQLADQVIRLHVVAHSDEAADQALKLEVRDAVLAEANTLLTGRENAQEAAQVLEDHLTHLSYTAAETLYSAGCDRQVSVSLRDVWFPTRHYESEALPQGGSLPAGTYQALRVVIGDGAGKNWWCVVFPALCMPAVTEGEPAVPTMGLSGENYALITESSQPYVFKFKALEWWGQVKGWLSDH